MGQINTNRKLSGQAGHSPGNRNAGVSIGDQAVLLFRVDHGRGNCQRGAGVDDWAGSVGNKNADLRLNHKRLHFTFYWLDIEVNMLILKLRVK